MKVVIDIPDDKAEFGLQVLHSLSFVKNVKEMSSSKIDLWEDLKAAAGEVKLHKQGKIKLKTAQELLNEL
jgi:hypothetical protein